jgi:hypothetical protein
MNCIFYQTCELHTVVKNAGRVSYPELVGCNREKVTGEWRKLHK